MTLAIANGGSQNRWGARLGTEYKDNINITKIHLPDGTVEDKTYDGMNRLRFHTVPKTLSESITTELRYNPWNGDATDSGHSGSLLKKIIDGESHAYEFKLRLPRD